MKQIFKPLILSFALGALMACNQSPSTTKGGDVKSISAVAETKSEFKEGVIGIKITTPGSGIGELLQQIDPAKGNTSEQMRKLMEKLSVKDKMKIDAQSKKNGMLNLAILMLPIKSTLYVKGAEATAKFDAVTYHGENRVNEAKKEGMMYVKSQNSAKEMTVSYTGDSFKEMNTNELRMEDYDIVKTDETENVAGYSCTKAVYTLKASAKPKQSEAEVSAGVPSGTVYKIDVWTSKEMPKSVNFLHPLYVKEDAGIMKLNIQYQKDNDLKIVYEFASVESRPVTAAELAVKQTAKIHDFGKDKMTVGMQMFGIILGM